MIELIYNSEEDDNQWYLNYDEIAYSENLIPAIRLLALRLKNNPYISIGDWLLSLTPASFSEVNELAQTEDEESYEMQQMLLLTLMLSHAEGSQKLRDDMEGLNQQLSMLRHLIVFSSLERKGLIRCHYENFTLGTDLGDRILVDRL